MVEKSLGVDFGPLRKDARPILDEIAAGIVTDVRQIAARKNCSARKISTTILLALYDAQAEWSRQYRMLAFFQAVRQVAYRP